MEYKIVWDRADELRKLEEVVNLYMAEGWAIAGGLCVIPAFYSGGVAYLAQPMVREVANDEIAT